jgi:hypothetical protein
MPNRDASNLRFGRFVETAVGGEVVRAFVPPPLPPRPPVDVLGLLPQLGLAERALGRLAIRPSIADGRYGVFFAAYQIASIDLTKPESVGDVSGHVSAMSPG